MLRYFFIWIQAARLRTLPLSLAGIILGNALALGDPFFDYQIFVLALLTATGFQVLSNFANDYGDGIKGTDNAMRIGPQRVLQQQLLSPKALLTGIFVTALISFGLAMALIITAFDGIFDSMAWMFILLTLAAIVAAFKYTVGKNAYGYIGLGDFFVFVFFGLVAVMGSYFLQTQSLSLISLYFALSMGLLSVAVLNLNNMRDYKSDRESHKQTLVVLIGLKAAKGYHLSLIVLAIALSVWGGFQAGFLPIQYLFGLSFLSLLWHLRIFYGIENERDYDGQLKLVALSSFFLAVGLWIGMVLGG